jgi:molybdopterin-guanine dinucleotide biosynthesis protein A
VPDVPLTGGILAGGLGTRLGNIDKGWIEVGGQPLIERVLQRLQPQVDRVVINANRHAGDYARFGWPVVADAMPDFPGPLAGIAAILDTARTDWVLCVPVDAALLPTDLAPRLCEALRQNDSPAAYVCTADGPVPVCCLLSTILRSDLQARLAAGERSVQSWLARSGAVEVSFGDWPREYWSLNTPQERRAVESLLARHPR